MTRRSEARERFPQLSQAQQAAELQRCADDILYWVDTYCFTYDPREKEATLPFRLFARQQEFLLWLSCREEHEEDGLAEKCRDVGFTWLCCAYAVHRWLFRPGFAAGFGSRKLDLVDKLGDLDTIFEKIRFLIDHFPPWMVPEGFKQKVHGGYCKILNPQNGASITGEGGDQIGRGGRKSIYFVDEHAFLAHAKKVEASLSQNSRCKIRVSTPNGSGNVFFTLRFGGKVPVFTFKWTDDPRKSPEWYARQCEILDAVTVAQEIDIDYTASVEGICIPAKWVRAAVNLFASEKFRQAYPTYENLHHAVCGLDVAAGGRNRSVWTARRGPEVFRITHWQHKGPVATAWHAANLTEEIFATQLSYDGVAVGEGVTDAYNTSERVLNFIPLAVMGGNPATETLWPDGKRSCDRYANLRAELWMTLRSRFQKSFEFVELGVLHPPDEMISIPDHAELIAELSLPLMQRTNTDKVKIESKVDMKKRGVESPDFADSLAYAYAPQIGDWHGAAEAASAQVQQQQSRGDRGRNPIPRGSPRIW